MSSVRGRSGRRGEEIDTESSKHPPRWGFSASCLISSETGNLDAQYLMGAACRGASSLPLSLPNHSHAPHRPEFPRISLSTLNNSSAIYSKIKRIRAGAKSAQPGSSRSSVEIMDARYAMCEVVAGERRPHITYVLGFGLERKLFGWPPRNLRTETSRA